MSYKSWLSLYRVRPYKFTHPPAAILPVLFVFRLPLEPPLLDPIYLLLYYLLPSSFFNQYDNPSLLIPYSLPLPLFLLSPPPPPSFAFHNPYHRPVSPS